MSELNPCPFCGVEPDAFMDDDGWWYVTCLNMHCPIDSIQTAKFASKVRAVTAWNTRYEPTCKWKFSDDVVILDAQGACGFQISGDESIRDEIDYCPQCGGRVVDGEA